MSASAAARTVSSKAPSPDWHLSTPGASHPQLAEVQRARLMSATVRAVDELGYTDTSVAHITGRARVSRRTFYELFSDREACLAAALEDVLAAIERELAGASLDGLVWRERVRQGLWTILAFFDREPMLARVCVVQSLRGGPEILARREAILAQLAAVVDEGRTENDRGRECSPLIAEGVVGAAFSILYTRVLRGDPDPLTGLLGDLTGMIVLPYLGPTAARREQSRPLPAPAPERAASANLAPLGSDPLEGLSLRLTYRTIRVLECAADRPGSSNRQLGEDAGIGDQGQMSKLLGRLSRLGLLAQQRQGAHAKGEPNAWQLTALGTRVIQRLGATIHPQENGA